MSQPSDIIVVYCTVPDSATGERIAARLVEYRLVACVSLLPGVTSIYRWQGRVETATESLLMIKACADDYPRLEAAILSQHPYELPEIITVPVNGGLPAYLDWVRTLDNEAS